MTTTVLKSEKVIEIVRDAGPDDPLSVARAIEQAVLQSPEIQSLRSALKEAIITLERDGDEWGVCDRLRAAMEKQT